MKTIYFDVDTQMDFLYPSGALYAPGAEKIVAAVGRLNRAAAANGSLVISTMDAHAEDDAEFRPRGLWPSHCVAGTLGQRKPDCTLLGRRAVMGSSTGFALAAGTEQVLLEKQALDCFTNPNLRPFLESFGAERYVVYGVVTEYCVRYAAFGLLEWGRVEIVTDAVQALQDAAARATLDEFQALGGVLTRTSVMS